MKKLILLIILVIPFLAKTQNHPPRLPVDSIAYYQNQLRKMWRDTYDSLRTSERYTSIVEKIKSLQGAAKNYSGLALFVDMVHSDYSKFNSSIAQSGFGPLDEISYRLGIGISSNTNRVVIDFNFLTIGFNNRSKKGEEKITSSVSNLLEFNLGYDLIKSPLISIYPYAGLSLRESSLAYSKPVQLNTNYINITNIIQNEQSTYGSSTRLGYQAGVGFDFFVTPAPKKNNTMGGTALFLKAGMAQPVGKDKYKIHDIKYDPGIKQADWLVSFGLKLVGWH